MKDLTKKEKEEIIRIRYFLNIEISSIERKLFILEEEREKEVEIILLKNNKKEIIRLIELRDKRVIELAYLPTLIKLLTKNITLSPYSWSEEEVPFNPNLINKRYKYLKEFISKKELKESYKSNRKFIIKIFLEVLQNTISPMMSYDLKYIEIFEALLLRKLNRGY